MSFPLVDIVKAEDVVFERFDRALAKIERTGTSASIIAELRLIIDALARLASRDRFSLTVEISEDSKSIGEISRAQHLIDHINNFHSDGDSVDLSIEILKEVSDHRLSVFWPSALGKYLSTTPLSEAISALSNRFNDYLIFEYYTESLGSGSETIRFAKADDNGKSGPVGLDWRARSLALLQDNTFRKDSTGELIPWDFQLRNPIGIPSIDAFMNTAGATLSALFLCNFSELRGNLLTYRVNGYKLLSGVIDDTSKLVDMPRTLQRIADWAYGPDGNSDKVGLARNVISLCTHSLEEVANNSFIWDAIQSNYQIYLKENISTYLEVRGKLAEILAESTHRTHSLVEGLLDSIRNAVLITLTFVLTVVVINGIKDTSLRVIFSNEYTSIAIALLAFSSLALWASCRDASHRFEQGAKATKLLLENMYSHVMISTELDRHVSPTVDENRDYMARQMRRYRYFWLSFSLLIAAGFLAGNLAFGRTSDQAPTESASQGTSAANDKTFPPPFRDHDPPSVPATSAPLAAPSFAKETKEGAAAPAPDATKVGKSMGGPVPAQDVSTEQRIDPTPSLPTSPTNPPAPVVSDPLPPKSPAN